MFLNLFEDIVNLLFVRNIKLHHSDIGQSPQFFRSSSLGVKTPGENQEAVSVQSVYKSMSEAGIATLENNLQ